MVTSGIKERVGGAIYWLAQVFVPFAAQTLATNRSFGSAAVSGSFEFGGRSPLQMTCVNRMGTYGDEN